MKGQLPDLPAAGPLPHILSSCTVLRPPADPPLLLALAPSLSSLPPSHPPSLPPAPFLLSSPPLPGTASASASAIFRAATSRYTTAEASTLEDLRCQICLRPLHRCVALEPCGHNFCATCLSHYLGAQLQGGLALSCPFRWVVGGRAAGS